MRGKGFLEICAATALAALTFCSATAEAREWQKIAISGASCGDGKPYSVYLSRKDPSKIALELMGGGACWSFATCFGPSPLAWIHDLPVIEKSGFVSDDPAKSPVADYTLVYFPYCTGDVHLGAHVASYLGASVHHVGRPNLEKALEQLTLKEGLALGSASHFVAYGYSAGGLGALASLSLFEKYLKSGKPKLKAVLADSPGLHFGSSFWEKFTKEELADYAAAMRQFGYELREGDGNLAPIVPTLCKMYPDWRVGVLQASRDIIMSALFGGMTPDEHEKTIYGPTGLYQLTVDPSDNCAAWVPHSDMHMFLVSDESAGIDASGKTAREFAFDVISGAALPNYR